MPHCVLTLRLIGLTFDYYDGKKKADTLTSNQKKTALASAPTLLEMCGHVYFPGGFLVGPQFSMRRYLDCTTLKFEKVSFLPCLGLLLFIVKDYHCEFLEIKSLIHLFRLFGYLLIFHYIRGSSFNGYILNDFLIFPIVYCLNLRFLTNVFTF